MALYVGEGPETLTAIRIRIAVSVKRVATGGTRRHPESRKTTKVTLPVAHVE